MKTNRIFNCRVLLPAVLLISIFPPITTSAQEFTVYYETHNYKEYLAEQNGTQIKRKDGYMHTIMNYDYTYRLVYKNGESVLRSVVPDARVTVYIKGVEQDITTDVADHAKDYTYKDHQAGKQLQVVSLSKMKLSIPPTVFGIDEEAEPVNILGHECYKVDSPAKNSYWVTTDLPVDNEPFADGFKGIALMAVCGNRIYIATEILDYAVDDDYFKSMSSSETDIHDSDDSSDDAVGDDSAGAGTLIP